MLHPLCYHTKPGYVHQADAVKAARCKGTARTALQIRYVRRCVPTVALQASCLQVATETELITRSETFEQAMKENALAQFCDYKVSSCEGEDQETWLYLRILFEADPKRYILHNNTAVSC